MESGALSEIGEMRVRVRVRSSSECLESGHDDRPLFWAFCSAIASMVWAEENGVADDGWFVLPQPPPQPPLHKGGESTFACAGISPPLSKGGLGGWTRPRHAL